jgi:hypothetical protein
VYSSLSVAYRPMIKAEVEIGEEPNSIAIRLICGAQSFEDLFDNCKNKEAIGSVAKKYSFIDRKARTYTFYIIRTYLFNIISISLVVIES